MNKNMLQWIGAALLALVVVFLHQGPVVVGKNLIYQHATVEAKVRTLILERYFRKIDDKKLHEGALKGMFSVLDPYSAYIPPKKVRDFDLDTTGKFGGLGIIIEIRDGYLTVVTPLQGSPAQKAGILAGDKILEIKYQKKGKWYIRSGKFQDTEEARQVLLGRPGTQIHLFVQHESGQREEITITRAEITVRSVKRVKILDPKNGIGYIRIASFQSDTTREFEKALQNFQTYGVRSLILDLRFNPGGLLDEAISIADEFLDSGVIVEVRGRQEGSHKFMAHPGGKAQFLKKVIILVNRGSASASEIVSGALQDHKRALLVGERTWGKGSVQSIFEIPEGRDDEGRVIKSKVKLTTALYYTPSGRSIHRILSNEKKEGEEPKGGLEPDVEVKTTTREKAYLMRKQNEEDIEIEKNLAKGKDNLVAPPENLKEKKAKFFQIL
ncbi:MAG: S41 family peptidase, partial [Planctomycetota bacterium]